MPGGRRRARGLRVLVARAGPLEREIPFGVARQLLEPALMAAGQAEREALLSGSAGFARPVAFPDAADEFDPRADRRAAVLHGLYWLTANLASESPVLIAVDD